MRSGGDAALQESNVRPAIRRPPPWLWQKLSITPNESSDEWKFRVTHPFHPQLGRAFKILDLRLCWAEERVFYVGDDGQLAYIPASWTDVLPPDPYKEAGAGKALCRVPDLLHLCRLVPGAPDAGKRSKAKRGGR